MNIPFFAVLVESAIPPSRLNLIKQIVFIMGFLGWGMSFRSLNEIDQEIYHAFLDCPNVNPNRQLREWVYEDSLENLTSNILLGDNQKFPVRQLLIYCKEDSLDATCVQLISLAESKQLPILNLAMEDHLERAHQLVDTSHLRLSDKLWFG